MYIIIKFAPSVGKITTKGWIYPWLRNTALASYPSVNLYTAKYVTNNITLHFRFHIRNGYFSNHTPIKL